MRVSNNEKVAGRFIVKQFFGVLAEVIGPVICAQSAPGMLTNEVEGALPYGDAVANGWKPVHQVAAHVCNPKPEAAERKNAKYQKKGFSANL